MSENETKSLPENAYLPLKPGESYTPIVPAEAKTPELTTRSIVWGVVFCVIFTVASAYSGLKVGQVMEAAIPTSILAIGLQRFRAEDGGYVISLRQHPQEVDERLVEGITNRQVIDNIERLEVGIDRFHKSICFQIIVIEARIVKTANVEFNGMRIEIRAVMKLDTWAKLEGERGSVFADRPALRQSRD